MFKRHSQFFVSMRVALDALVVVASFAIAYLLRFESGLWPFEERALLEDTLLLAGFAAVVWPVVFNRFGLYQAQRTRARISEVFGVFQGTVVATLILVALTYFTRDHRYSRGVLVTFAIVSFVLVSATRLGFREAMRSARRRGFNLRYILVVGAGRLAREVVETIRDHRELGLRVVGVLSRHDEKVGGTVGGAPVVGTLEDLPAVLRRETIDQVIIALPIDHLGHMKQLMEVLSQETCDVKVVPDLYQYVTLSGGLEEFGGLPIISLQHGPLVGWNLVAKRAFDVTMASLALVVTAPVMIAVALAVKLTSRGPVLYAQERVGMDGHVFRMLKFRTMRVDSETEGARMASPDDPRRTPVGALLRSSSLDELPQLFNVLWGDMSLVGPRPERPVFIEEFKKRIPKYGLRHKVKSGITGWAQVNGLRGQTSIEKRIEYDLYYIENWSIGLDVKILARTALGGFLSRNAY